MAWSLLSLAASLWWWQGGDGFPFGRGHDPDPAYSNLAALTPESGAPILAGWSFLAAGAALVLRKPAAPRLAIAAIAAAWLTAGTLLLIVPDFRVLIRVAYAPVVLLGAPFGWPPGLDYAEYFQWAVINQYLCIAGGFAFARAALLGQRQVTGACRACGRRDTGGRFTSPEAAAR